MILALKQILKNLMNYVSFQFRLLRPKKRGGGPSLLSRSVSIAEFNTSKHVSWGLYVREDKISTLLSVLRPWHGRYSGFISCSTPRISPLLFLDRLYALSYVRPRCV